MDYQENRHAKERIPAKATLEDKEYAREKAERESMRTAKFEHEYNQKEKAHKKEMAEIHHAIREEEARHKMATHARHIQEAAK